MTDNERNMSRDEMALRLKIETGLRESYESKCAKLKKELEDIKVAFKMEHDENILRMDSLDRLCDKYRELEKEHEDLQKRQNACADVWVKCEERNDELKRTLEAKNEQIKNLQVANWRQSVDILALRRQRELRDKDIQAKNEEIKTLRKKNLDLKNENERLKLLNNMTKIPNTITIEKQNPGYFTPPTQPINIENLNITYYENGPVWTNEEDEED